MTEERWQKAINHAREMLEEYKKIPAGALAAMMIQEDICLYENGDRSEALLESLEDIS